MDNDWSSVEPFGIDHGELDGLRPQDIFVLGVEWQTIRENSDKPFAFSQLIHAANRERIEKILKRRSRQYRVSYLSDDVSESYLLLEVAACTQE